jgi:hypothetical protein
MGGVALFTLKELPASAIERILDVETSEDVSAKRG